MSVVTEVRVILFGKWIGKYSNDTQNSSAVNNKYCTTSEYFMRSTLTLRLTYCEFFIFLCIFTTYPTPY